MAKLKPGTQEFEREYHEYNRFLRGLGSPKIDRAEFARVIKGTTAKVQTSAPRQPRMWRDDPASRAPSAPMDKYNCFVPNSPTQPHMIRRESPEVQAQIIEKSKKLAPAFSKGAYQLIDSFSDLNGMAKKK